MAIKCNMGKIDRGLRVVIGAVLIYLGAFDTELIANQVVKYILLVLGSMNILTAVIAFCPMYVPAHISTISKSKSNE